MMKDFIFSNTTKVYFGKDQLQHLSEEISKFGKKVLLVYGGGSIKRIGLYDRVMEELNKADMTVFELPGVEPNPHHTTVNKGAAICKKEGIDVVLAVGGVSTIDATKAIAATAKYEGDDCWDMLTRMQEEVLKTVVKYAPVAIDKPDDYEARANLMWASSWALNGFLFSGISQDAVCHMIEHEVSAFYDITHGHGLAIIIPKWLTYILNESTAPKIKRLGVNVLGVDTSLSDMDGAKAAIAALEKLFYETLGLKSRFSDLGIDDKNFALMAKKACGAKGKLEGITALTPDDVEKIFRMCL